MKNHSIPSFVTWIRRLTVCGLLVAILALPQLVAGSPMGSDDLFTGGPGGPVLQGEHEDGAGG